MCSRWYTRGTYGDSVSIKWGSYGLEEEDGGREYIKIPVDYRVVGVR